MKAWDVNWEVKQLRLQFEEEDFQVSMFKYLYPDSFL